MTLKKVSEGDVFVPSVEFKNRAVDLIEQHTIPFFGDETSSSLNVQADEILVVNDSTEELDWFWPVAITGLATEALTEENSRQQQVFKVKKITAENKDNVIVILQETLAPKAGDSMPVVKAIASGVVPVYIGITDSTHKFADIDVNVGQFFSAASGKYQLAYPPTATGNQLLKIILGGGGESSGDTYKGYFKVVDISIPAVPAKDGNPAQPAVAKITISAGVFLHGLAKKTVDETEVTVTASGAIYLKVVWSGLDYVCTLEYANNPTNINGTIYIEICSFELADSKTSNLIQKQYGVATAPSGLL